MISKCPSKFFKYFAVSKYPFSSLINITAFPYKFGNVNSITETKPRLQKIAQDVISLNKSTCEGFKLAYRAILNSLKDKKFHVLNRMLERNLYNKFKNEYDNIEKKGCKLVLYNEDSEIEVKPKSIGFIMGGSIDRSNKEKITRELKVSDIHVLTCIPNINPIKVDKNSVKKIEALMKNLKLIVKFTAEIQTSCKLGVVCSKGENAIDKYQGDTKEVHELTLEGETTNTEFSIFPFKIFSTAKSILKRGFELENVTAVDFDNALNGNKREGSSYL
eukprot:TRINITY_DN6328_c0_g1_i1.p1 TRINITY_DN6328_c0_g1~~TRINITY_DN6328_c0_g1_i1.p1  ORF type:complete len:275 (+),score=27.94 TRINITY_DN6328_c0_g1_i1:66-890(+)